MEKIILIAMSILMISIISSIDAKEMPKSYWNSDSISDGVLTFSIDKDLKDYEIMIHQAFKSWEDKLQPYIEFKEVKKKADIEVKLGEVEQPSPSKNRAAEAIVYIYDKAPVIAYAEIVVDSDREIPVNFISVLKHEIGHTLGLSHTNNPNSLMYKYMTLHGKSIDECSVKLALEYNINNNLFVIC